MTCDICKDVIEMKGPNDIGGNNALPVVDGRCCDECNRKVVIPMRIRIMMVAEKNEAAGS
jgi:hypothetical protein